MIASYESGYDDEASHKQFMASVGRSLKAQDAYKTEKTKAENLAHLLSTSAGAEAEKAGFGACIKTLGECMNFSALFRKNPEGYFFCQGFKQFSVKRENPRSHSPQAVAAFEAGKAAGKAFIGAKK